MQEGTVQDETIHNFWTSLIQNNSATMKCEVMFLLHLLKKKPCEMRSLWIMNEKGDGSQGKKN